MSEDTKNAIIGIVGVLLVILLLIGISVTETYPMSGYITHIDNANDIVYVESFNTNRSFEFKGTEDFMEGDVVTFQVDINGKVVRPTYVGWIE